VVAVRWSLGGCRAGRVAWLQVLGHSCAPARLRGCAELGVLGVRGREREGKERGLQSVRGRAGGALVEGPAPLGGHEL
jgi:hypothetical protein